MNSFNLRVYAFVFFSLFFSARGYSEEIQAESKISAVTVYSGSARVTRSARIDLSVGEHSIEFADIVPNIDENSLTVSGEGTAEVKLFGAYKKTQYLKDDPDRRVGELQQRIQDVQDKINVENANLQDLEHESAFLSSIVLYANQQIPKELITTLPPVKNLEELTDFLSARFNTVNQKKLEVRIKLRELNKELVVFNQELSQVQNPGAKSQQTIVVDLECTKAGEFSLDLSHMVQGANWRPVYDARGYYDEGKVELTSYGIITQKTGEDWEDVQLTLSTARPMVGGRMPYVAPWVLQSYAAERNNRMAGVRRDVASRTEQYEAFKGGYEPYYLDAKIAEDTPVAAMQVAAQQVYSDVAQSGISVVYKIARPADIKSDGTEGKFPIATQTLKADFEYATYPRGSLFAYLGSRVVNAKDLQLLAGEVNLFLENEYIGKSSIDNIGPGQEFDIYLGIDENVKVKREEVARKVNDVLIAGIPSPNKTTTVKNKLSIENNTHRSIKVKIYEAMPVSENEQVKVKIFDVGDAPKEKNWEDRKGIWFWKIDLEPNAKREIFYSVSVERGRDNYVEGF